MKNRTLIIDGRTIKKLVGIRESIKIIEKAFKYFGEGKTQMPAKLYINLPGYNGDFRAMPAYIEGLNCCIKWVNVHPENKRKKLPTVMGIIILSDPKNGYPVCIMDGTYATALRTAAAAGVAAKYLAKNDSTNIGLVGCGAQAKTQLLALNELFNIKQINVCGIKPEEPVKFIRDMKNLNIKMEAKHTVKDCVKGCDIIVTTTPSRKPLVKLEWLKKTVHINAIGADAKGKQELHPEILKKAKVVVDAWQQASHSGEINIPLKKRQISKKDIYADIGEIVAGKKRARTSKDTITVFDSTGLAIQDVAIANLIYKTALKNQAGTWIKIV